MNYKHPSCDEDSSTSSQPSHSKEVSTEMIDYPEKEVINILERIKLAKDSENTVQGLISKDTNFRSN